MTPTVPGHWLEKGLPAVRIGLVSIQRLPEMRSLFRGIETAVIDDGVVDAPTSAQP